MTCIRIVCRWSLIALWQWTLHFLKEMRIAQAVMRIARYHVCRASRTILGIVNNDYKSVASTPLQKHIRKEKSHLKEFLTIKVSWRRKQGPSGVC